MSNASISELKAHLSRYLREVRRGGEIQVLDRGLPIARISPIPASSSEDGERRDRLVRSGVIRPGTGSSSGLLAENPIEVQTSVLDALIEERADRL